MAVEPESKLPGIGTTIFSVMTRKADERGAINLSQGFPDFPVPERLAALLEEAVREGHNQYAPMPGAPRLRRAVAEKIGSLYGTACDPETQVTVTSGATEALFDAVQAVVRPGDEVILFDPAYDAYEPAVTLAGGRAVRLPLTEPGFGIDWQRLEDALGERTRLVILNTPHNPAGAVLDRAALDRLAEALRPRSTLVLSDEVYEHIVLDGAHASVLQQPELAERAFVVSSFGKTFHCTGWKIGYCVAPPALTAELRKVHQFVTFATMHPAQVAFARFLEEHPEHYRELPAFYRRKRDRLAGHLEAAGFRLRPAAGTYFQLADYGELADEPDTLFAERLIDRAGVAAIPVSVFYRDPPPAQRLVRFCFAKRDATLDESGRRLQSLSA
ncbi:MAG TPA: methionine aminotransferase [Gammaproteobacteria bacterium]|nr:methionine aminotransferase [Gammaproteobacteria bacterium]